MLLCDAPQVLSAEGEVDYVDLTTRVGLAKGLIGKISWHYLLHEEGCPGEVGEACVCWPGGGLRRPVRHGHGR